MDQHNQLGGYLGARAVPPDVFVDEAGGIVWMKIGDFSVDNPGDIRTLEAWLGDGSERSAGLTAGDAPKGEIITTRLRLADSLLQQGQPEQAATAMRHQGAEEQDQRGGRAGLAGGGAVPA